ncbi:MAG TPA: hypothetical protein VFF77_00575 [Holophagaceae bacterium]|nr:hypothetical protein [Holophagaceae bacterium]
MADAPTQAAPKKGMNPILKWLLIGCGTIVLLCILAFASCVYLFKKKVYDPAAAKVNEAKTELAKQGIEVDTSNGVVAGIQSATNQGIVKSMVAEGQGVIAALPVAERPAAEAAYKALDAKKAQMSAEDMADLIKAHAAYQQAMMANIQNATSGRPKPMGPEASRALVKQVQEIALRH